jgi:hypothetical protein
MDPHGTVEDKVLEALAHQIPLLQRILLNGASGYTTAGVVRLVGGSKHLRRIRVSIGDKVVTEQVRAHGERRTEI